MQSNLMYPFPWSFFVTKSILDLWVNLISFYVRNMCLFGMLTYFVDLQLFRQLTSIQTLLSFTWWPWNWPFSLNFGFVWFWLMFLRSQFNAMKWLKVQLATSYCLWIMIFIFMSYCPVIGTGHRCTISPSHCWHCIDL